MAKQKGRSSKSKKRKSRKKGTPRRPPLTLTLDQWLDILGVGLVLLALLTILSFLSASQGALTGLWLRLLSQTFGWGVYVVPLGMGGAGLWLVLRHFGDRLPQVEGERVIGAVLLFLTALAGFHMLAGPFYDQPWPDLAERGVGGGYLGMVLAQLLQGAVGTAGAILVLLGLLVIGGMLAFSLSPAEIIQGGVRLYRRVWPSRPADLPLPGPPEPPPASETKPPSAKPTSRRRPPPSKAPAAPARPAGREPSKKPTTTPAEPPPLLHPRIIGGQQRWQLPDITTIFEPGGEQDLSEAEIRERVQIIEQTLQSLGVPGRVVEVNRGPVITQFGVEPGFIEGRGGKRTKVKVSRISALADDLALALAAPSIRIEAPVPGKSIVGIEVPNAEVALVALRDIIESEPFRQLRSPLRLALGQDVSGQPVVADLTAMPHLLIAGTTGSGKSVCINAIIACLLAFNTPDQIKLLMVDPKRVELTQYNGIPHLLTPVVVDLERVVGILQWVTREMDKRYRRFAKAGARNIADYNRQVVKRGEGDLMPYIVVIIDELADLMMLAPDETERTITRLAQMARATGIHLVIATQRPSVDVVTGLIKANFPARISFATASAVDSRVILDMTGAERLLGRGDMLYLAPDASQPIRLQGAFVSDAETRRLIRYWKGARGTQEQEKAGKKGAPQQPPPSVTQPPLWKELQKPPRVSRQEPEDALWEEAVAIVRKTRRASISLLQRRLRIGYTRAARLIDRMEEKGIIGPATEGGQGREVLIPPEETS